MRKPFDYREAEWAEIQTEIVSVRKSLLTSAERASLVEAASRYRRDLAERKAGGYLPPRSRAKSWAKVERLCRQLSEVFETAGRNRNGEYWQAEPIAVLSKELSLALSIKFPGAEVYIPDYLSRTILTIGDFVELLSAARTGAAELSQPFLWSISRLASWTGRQDPQLLYFQHVIWLWTDIFGGKLRYSRDPASNRIRGPFVRYFMAVIGPVMGNATPSLQSLPDIVNRQKDFYKWLDAWVAGGEDRHSLARSRLLGEQRPTTSE